MQFTPLLVFLCTLALASWAAQEGASAAIRPGWAGALRSRAGVIPSKQVQGTQALKHPSIYLDPEAPDLTPSPVFPFARAQP